MPAGGAAGQLSGPLVMPPFQLQSSPRPSSLRAPGEPRSFAPGGVTLRQLECLAWVQEGKSATDIGAILGISGRTVDKHIYKLCETLGVRTRMQAVLKARDLGLLKRTEA